MINLYFTFYFSTELGYIGSELTTVKNQMQSFLPILLLEKRIRNILLICLLLWYTLY